MELMTLDVVGLIVSVLIFRQGWVILMSAFTQLTDGSVSTNTKRSLLKSLDPILPSNSSSYTIPDSPSGSHSNNLSPSSSPTSSSFPESASHSDSFNYSQNILGIKNLRAMRAGALMFVDVEVEVPSRLSIGEAKEVEDEIERRLREKRKEIKEVRIKFYPIDNRE